MVNTSLSRTLTETANLISNPIREDHLEELGMWSNPMHHPSAHGIVTDPAALVEPMSMMEMESMTMATIITGVTLFIDILGGYIVGQGDPSTRGDMTYSITFNVINKFKDLIKKWNNKIRLGRLNSIEVESFIYQSRKLIQTLPHGEKRNILIFSLDKMIEASMDGNKSKLTAIVNDVKKKLSTK